jgi:light-regulated signal transduction histidine kinase (bacteriophytochrome)
MKDGSYRWFLCSAIPLCNDEGNVVKWYGSATDIDELENLVAQRTAELSDTNKELEAFIFSVSHDLRAPLRAISGFSQILLDDYRDKFDVVGLQMLQKVWGNADKMKNLIEDLLRLSRTGRQELSYTSIDMPALFNSMIEEVRQIYPEREVITKMSPLGKAYGDLALLKQVISNLLSNAVKFSGKKPVSEIEIGSFNGEGEMSYYVKDNGAGFDMKYVHELFGVFRRLNNAEDYEGTGVGLALVKRIIDKHGGRVWAISEPGQGATFYFSLPVKNVS